MADKNRERYNWVWRQVPIQDPSIWASWEVCKDFVGKRCLEIGCGNYPRIPLENSYFRAERESGDREASSYFLDLSETAVENLRTKGLNAYQGTAEELPFEADFFDLVVAWDVIEHVPNDQKAFAEVSRVLKPKGYFLFSVPLGKKHFSSWDTAVGHLRRYEAAELEEILKKNSFRMIKFQGQNLLKHLSRIPLLIWLLSKLVNPPLRSYQIGLPIPYQLRALLVRGYASLGRALAVPWKTGRLADVVGEANLTAFCRKNK